MPKKTLKKKPKTKAQRDTYSENKEELLRMYIERKNNRQLAEYFAVTPDTIARWITKLLNEEGNLTVDKIAEMKKSYIVKTSNETELAKKTILKVMTDTKNINFNKDSVAAARALALVQKSELDVLTRFGVIDPEEHKLTGDSAPIGFIIREVSAKEAKKKR